MFCRVCLKKRHLHDTVQSDAGQDYIADERESGKKKVLRYDLTYQLSGPRARAQRSQKDRTAPFPLVPPSLKIIDIIYCRTGESGQPQTLALAQNRGGGGEGHIARNAAIAGILGLSSKSKGLSSKNKGLPTMGWVGGRFVHFFSGGRLRYCSSSYISKKANRKADRFVH